MRHPGGDPNAAGVLNRPEPAPPVRLHSPGAPIPPALHGYRRCTGALLPLHGHRNITPSRCTEKGCAAPRCTEPPPQCTEPSRGGGSFPPLHKGFTSGRAAPFLSRRPAHSFVRSHAAAAQRPARSRRGPGEPRGPAPHRFPCAVPGGEGTLRQAGAATGCRRPDDRPVYTGAARTTAAGGAEEPAGALSPRHAEAL